MVLTKNIGGQAALSGDVENYTGYQFIAGPELGKKFGAHMKKFKIEVKEGVEAKAVRREKDHFVVKAGEEEHRGRTVIVAIGEKPKTLNVPGEKEFKNRGVSYCATCDAPLFADKEVAVVGGGNSGMDATLQLMKIAEKIYLIDIAEELKGDPVMIGKILKSEKVQVLNSTVVKEISGGNFVEKIKVQTKGAAEKVLNVQGVFVEIGWVTEPIQVEGPEGELEMTDRKEIVVNSKCETNIPGLFAAGDCTNIPENQIIAAAGQGCIAALSAFKYISARHF